MEATVITEFTYGPAVLQDPDTSDNLQRGVLIENVWNADQSTTVTPLDSLGNPVALQSSNDGLLPQFSVSIAENPDGLVWVQMPGITGRQRLRADNIGDVLADLADAQAAALAAQAAAEQSAIDSQAAVTMINNSQLGQILDENGRLREQVWPITIRAAVEIGRDPSTEVAYIDPDGDSGSAERVNLATPESVALQVAGMGGTTPAQGRLAIYGANGTLSAGTPTADGHAMTRGSAAALVSVQVQAALATSLRGATVLVYDRGSGYRWKDNTVVTVSSRPAWAQLIFLGTLDPGDLMLPGDIHLDQP